MKKMYLLMSLLLVALCATAQEVTVVIDKLVAGGLEKALKDQNADPKKVISLTIKSGDLNGTDIHLLRYMGGGDELGQDQKDYSMQELDISGANIVTGGSFYIKTDAGKECFTQKDTISSGMFINCHTLKSVKTPTSVTGMDGSQTFDECLNLEQVTLSDKIRKIPDYAFDACSNLKSIVLPGALEEIGKKAFHVTASLSEIKIPESCLIIGDGAFFRSGIAQATLPKALKELQPGIFADCSLLKSINLEAELEYVGEGAFLRCQDLVIDKVKLGKSGEINQDAFYGVKVLEYEVNPENPNFSSADGVLFNKDKTVLITYNIGSARTTYTVPSSVDSLGTHAFYISTLKGIDLPTGLKKIGDGCFHSCVMLESIVLPDQVKVLPTIGFADCLKLSSVTLPSQLEEIEESCFMRCFKLEKLDLPNKLKYIGPQVFYFTSIKTLHLPATVDELATDAFLSISGFQSITVDKANPYFCDVNGILFTKDKSELISVPQEAEQEILALGPEVKEVWEYAGSFTHNLKRVTFLNPDCKIEDWAFFSSSVKEMVLPANLDTLHENVLNACEQMLSCKFPDKLKVIERDAVGTCHSLQSVVLPATLEEIKDGAFSGCSGLKQMQCFAKEPPICGDSVFYAVDQKTVTLYVPTGSKAAYQGSSQWKEFENIVERDTPVSIEQTPENSVKLYNVDGGIQAESTEQPQMLYIYKVSGQFVMSKKISGSEFIPLASGMYAVRIGSEAKIISVK